MDVENPLEGGNGPKLRTTPYPGQLYQRTEHAGEHEKEYAGQDNGSKRGTIGINYLLISQRDQEPHANRYRRELHKFAETVNGVQASTEFSNPCGNLMSHASAMVRRPAFDPRRHRLSFGTDDPRTNRQTGHECDPKQSAFAKLPVVVQVFEPWREEDRADQQHRETAKIENPFHRPHRQLGGEGQIELAGDQVRANHLAQTTQQSDTGETNEGGCDQCGRCGFLYRAQEDSPAYGTHEIRNIGEGDPQEDVDRSPATRHLACLREKYVPIKAAPGAELDIKKRGQHRRYDKIGKQSFRFHRRWEDCARRRSRSAHTSKIFS